MNNAKLVLLCLLALSAIVCDKSFQPEPPSATAVQGKVVRPAENGGAPVSPAYVFADGILLTQTDENGNFYLDDLNPGDLTLVCSAMNARDTTITINVAANQTTSIQIALPFDYSTGSVYGEFQDLDLFQSQLVHNQELSAWDEKQEYEGVTGATLQWKWLDHPVGDCLVAFSDSILAYADGFGQYWFEIQNGTYPFIASCEGYVDQTRVFTVQAEKTVYMNFYLQKKE